MIAGGMRETGRPRRAFLFLRGRWAVDRAASGEVARREEGVWKGNEFARAYIVHSYGLIVIWPGAFGPGLRFRPSKMGPVNLHFVVGVCREGVVVHKEHEVALENILFQSGRFDRQEGGWIVLIDLDQVLFCRVSCLLQAAASRIFPPP